jgi:hypothetical protein
MLLLQPQVLRLLVLLQQEPLLRVPQALPLEYRQPVTASGLKTVLKLVSFLLLLLVSLSNMDESCCKVVL